MGFGKGLFWGYGDLNILVIRYLVNINWWILIIYNNINTRSNITLFDIFGNPFLSIIILIIHILMTGKLLVRILI